MLIVIDPFSAIFLRLSSSSEIALFWLDPLNLSTMSNNLKRRHAIIVSRCRAMTERKHKYKPIPTNTDWGIVLGEKTEIDYLKELKEKIKRSGFPLEIEVLSILNSARRNQRLKGMDFSVGSYYLDKDKNIGRELDISVKIPVKYRGEFKGKKSDLIGIFLHLLIQCKKVPGNAWVFFKTPQELVPVPQCTSVLDSLEWIPRSNTAFAYLPDLHYRKTVNATARDEYVLEKKRSNGLTDNLFDAIITLAKATSYQLETNTQDLMSTLKRFKNVSTYVVSYISVYYPIIIFDGKMYLAEPTSEYGEMEPTPTDHVCLFFDYISGSCDIDLYVDIVQREAFGKYLQNVVSDVETFQDALETEAGVEFRQEVEKALSWYRSREKEAINNNIR